MGFAPVPGLKFGGGYDTRMRYWSGKSQLSSRAKRGDRETKYGRWRRGTNVQLVGIEEVSERLRIILENTEDLSQFWCGLYHPMILQGESEFYDSQGDNKWPDLTDRYLFYKAKKGAGTRTLIGTPARKKFPRPRGTLHDSLTSPNHPLHIFDVSARWLRTGTKDPLANIHFAKKGRRKRKALDAKSVSMQKAFREAVMKHAEAYGDMWGG
jgi:hypothetical protein